MAHVQSALVVLAKPISPRRFCKEMPRIRFAASRMIKAAVADNASRLSFAREVRLISFPVGAVASRETISSRKFCLSAQVQLSWTGCEFDYSGFQRAKRARRALRIFWSTQIRHDQTDPEFADRTYIEPSRHEVMRAFSSAKNRRVLPTMGGQNASRSRWNYIARRVAGNGVRLIGANEQATPKGTDVSSSRKRC